MLEFLLGCASVIKALQVYVSEIVKCVTGHYIPYADKNVYFEYFHRK